jgi:hypothetical protein
MSVDPTGALVRIGAGDGGGGGGGGGDVAGGRTGACFESSVLRTRDDAVHPLVKKLVDGLAVYRWQHFRNTLATH